MIHNAHTAVGTVTSVNTTYEYVIAALVVPLRYWPAGTEVACYDKINGRLPFRGETVLIQIVDDVHRITGGLGDHYDP